MAFNFNRNKKNILIYNTTQNYVNEDQQVQELSKMVKPNNRKKNKQRGNSVCLPSGSNTNNSRSQSVPAPNIRAPSIPSMVRPCYPHYHGQTIRVPLVAAYPVYTYPAVPVVVDPIVNPLYSYRCAVVPQVINPVVQPVVTETPEVHYNINHEASVSYTNSVIEATDDNVQYFAEEDENTYYEGVNNDDEDTSAVVVDDNIEIPEDNEAAIDVTATLRDSDLDPIDMYLSLPKKLFPAPRTLVIDPNKLIDAFCKLKNVNEHVPWMLDLEYGIPKLPVLRQIPVYNVYYNNFFCKYKPNVLHPDFNSCSDEFKEVFLFYYDSLMSTLYTGYQMFNGETSFQDFESWLQLPMQVLGMCWL